MNPRSTTAPLPVAGCESVTVATGRLDPLAGRGLADAVRDDPRIRVVGLGLDNAALLRCVAGLAPRVIVVSDSVDYAVLAGIKSQAPKTGLLVLARASRLGGTLLLAAGIGCVAQDAPVADIIEAIHLSASGQSVLVAGDGPRVAPRHVRQLHSLTRRERDVLQHLSRGESAEEIALALRVRPETIRTHTASIRRKLNVASKRELIGIQMLRAETIEK